MKSKKVKKQRKRSKKLSVDQIVGRELRKKGKKIDKTRKKAIKCLVEPRQKRSFNLATCNVKQEIINSYQ